MAEIIDFSQFALPDPADLAEMDRDQLLCALERVEEQIALLDEEEPRDMESEEYEAWGERHEDLEDLADEIMELLEEAGE